MVLRLLEFNWNHLVELRFLLPNGLGELELARMFLFLEETLIFGCHGLRGDVLLLDVDSFPFSLNSSCLLLMVLSFSINHSPFLLGPSLLSLEHLPFMLLCLILSISSSPLNVL